MFRKSFFSLFCALACLTLFTGCDNETVQNADLSFMEKEAVLDYEVTLPSPYVNVDRVGYSLGEDIVLPYKSKVDCTSFDLIDSKTGEKYLSLELSENDYDPKLKEYSGNIRLEQITDSGSWHIHNDLVGDSYDINVSGDHYKKLLDERIESFREKCRGTGADPGVAFSVLMTYEWYPELFLDEDGDEVPDILNTMGNWFQSSENANAKQSTVYMWAALFAKYGYLYQNYDKAFATECIQRSGAILDKAGFDMSKEAFLAVAELYRATGKESYLEELLKYKDYFLQNDEYPMDRTYMYGILTFMCIYHENDMELSRKFMSDLMERARECADSYREVKDTQELLDMGTVVTGANYIQSAYQYYRTCRRMIHYISGENEQGINSFYEPGCDEQYILILGSLAHNEMNYND
ncbi:MAG: glycoside hydrolase family 9 protein [Lachnospiraceae bacterium]|nr:glycoside hydrolase family 9 protein [Lachnospiraceae bacterium]